MSEVEKLAARLEREGVVSAHATWGDEADKLTREERAGVINRMLDEADADMANTVPVPVSQLRDIHEALQKLSDLGRATAENWMAMPKEEAELRHKIRALAEFPAIFAGQWLPRRTPAPPQRAADGEA